MITAAIGAGHPISWTSLQPALAELAGAQALEEAVLDAALDRELASRQISVSPAQIEAERIRLLDAIASDSGLSPELADQALARIRLARGLGPHRFAALLARNAKLRLLTSDITAEKAFTADELARETELTLGPKATAVLILVNDEKEAATLRAALLEPPGPSIERLSSIATARSLDASSRSGGRIGPIHPNDPRVAASLRGLLATLPIGELSPVVAIENGYALLMIESRTEPIAPTIETATSIEASLRERTQRLAMERLARRLIAESSTNVIDESLRWNWDRRVERARE